VVGHAVLGPQPLDQGEVFLEPLDAHAFRHAEGVELDLAIAQADAEDEVAARDHVEARHRLRGVDRVVQVEQQDAEPERHLARFRREPRQQRHRLELLVVALVEIMLAGHERVPAAIARVPHHHELILERAHHVGCERVLVGNEDTDFHAILRAGNKQRRHLLLGCFPTDAKYFAISSPNLRWPLGRQWPSRSQKSAGVSAGSPSMTGMSRRFRLSITPLGTASGSKSAVAGRYSNWVGASATAKRLGPISRSTRLRIASSSNSLIL